MNNKRQKNFIRIRFSDITSLKGMPILKLELDVPEIVTVNKIRIPKSVEEYWIIPGLSGFYLSHESTVKDAVRRFKDEIRTMGVFKFIEESKIPMEYKERIFTSMILYNVIAFIEEYMKEYDGYQFDNCYTVDDKILKEYIGLVMLFLEGGEVADDIL